MIIQNIFSLQTVENANLFNITTIIIIQMNMKDEKWEFK